MGISISTNNYNEETIKDRLIGFSEGADQITVAVAFFIDHKLIESWISKGIDVTLIVGLRPPTDYYSLKKLLPRTKLKIRFLGDNFHSKIYIFFNNNQPFASVIGSSNLTNGGLCNNIETNVVFHEDDCLADIAENLSFIKNRSKPLQPDTLERYKDKFDAFRKKLPPEPPKKQFPERVISTIKPVKEARDFYDFWRIVDSAKDLVENISKDEFPNIPIYLTLDHFWHWVVCECPHKKLIGLHENQEKRERLIPQLFKEYCKWDKNNHNYTKDMHKNSKKHQKVIIQEKHTHSN
ncbi:phospholipase D family protein [Shewanella woodyi]|uniref:phospholipase D family protein n=1 Tax=Shewanella woodyi TaxID=60961 RepID=UPI0037486B5D